MIHTLISAGSELSRSANSAPPKVLCIDDDPEISRAIQLRLQQCQVEVLRAFFGMHGYWLALTERPDAIVTDLGMPQGRGDYVLESLKCNPQTAHIPVIVLTGKRDEELTKRLEALGAAAVLHKPICFDELLDALAPHIRLKGEETCRSA